MKKTVIIFAILLLASVALADNEPDDYLGAVTYCGIPGTNSPTSKGWLDYGLCDHGQLSRLVIVKTIKSKNGVRLTYELQRLENRIYNRAETGLDCNFSVNNCNVEAFK